MRLGNPGERALKPSAARPDRPENRIFGALPIKPVLAIFLGAEASDVIKFNSARTDRKKQIIILHFLGPHMAPPPYARRADLFGEHQAFGGFRIGTDVMGIAGCYLLLWPRRSSLNEGAQRLRGMVRRRARRQRRLVCCSSLPGWECVGCIDDGQYKRNRQACNNQKR